VIAGIAGERGVEMRMLSFAATAARSKDWRVEIPVTAPAGAEIRA
jgi:hypothetical protein